MGGPKIAPFHFYLLLFYYLFIIIFEALRLVAAIFMCVFYLAAAERPQHCALVVLGRILVFSSSRTVDVDIDFK